MIPQLIVLGIGILSLGLHMGKDGQSTNQKYNWITKIITMIISWGVLYWGGFFDCFL